MGPVQLTQMTLTIKAAAIPTTVGSFVAGDVNPNLTIGATTTIEGDYFNVLDQYGRIYDISSPPVAGGYTYGPATTPNALGQYRVVVRLDNAANTNVALSAAAGATAADATPADGYQINADGQQVVLTGMALGSSAIDTVLQDSVVATTDASGNPLTYKYADVPASTLTQNVVVNEKSNYTSYSVADLGTLCDTALLGGVGPASNYEPQVTVYGIVNNTKYILSPSEYTVFSDSSAVTINPANNDVIVSGVNFGTPTAATATANLVVTINADTNPVVITKPITISSAGPAATTLSLDSSYGGTDYLGITHPTTITKAAYDNANEISIKTPVAGVPGTGFSTTDLKAILDKAMIVDDQYAEQWTPAYLHLNSHIVVTNLPLDTLANGSTVQRTINDGGLAADGLAADGTTTNLIAGDTFSVTYVIGAKAFSLKVVVQ